MNLHQMELFKVVADEGGFARAARSLHLEQSTVSTQVRRLEHAVGLELFRRTPGGLVLTEAGSTLYASARAILDHHQLAERRLEAMRTGAEGVVAVGSTQTGALYVLLDAVAEFRGRHPRVHLHVQVDVADRLLQRLSEGALDLALEWEPLERPGLVHEALGRYPFLVVAAPGGDLGAGGGEVDPERFRAQTYFTLRYGADAPAFVETELARRGLLPARIVRLPSIDTVKRMVAAGLGVSVLSSASVRHEVAAGRLAAAPLAGLRLRRAIRVFRRAEGSLPPAALAFLALLRGRSTLGDPAARWRAAATRPGRRHETAPATVGRRRRAGPADHGGPANHGDAC